MSHTEEILAAAPRRSPFDSDELAAAIDACLDCVQTCTSCVDSDVAEPDVAEMRTCIALCIECADVCVVTARTLSRQAVADDFLIERLLQACVRACSSSADECHRHAPHHEHCAVCERTCRICIEACSRLLDAEALRELQSLAGG